MRALRKFAVLVPVLAAFALQVGSRPAFAGDTTPLQNMISPVSVPTLNEDPRVDTEIRPMYMFTSIANDFATNGGCRHEPPRTTRASCGLPSRTGLLVPSPA